MWEGLNDNASVIASGASLLVCPIARAVYIILYIYIYIYTSKRYSVGARLSGRTTVITRCNLAVSDMYMSVFGKNATDSLYVLLKSLAGTSADQLPHRKSRSLATA